MPTTTTTTYCSPKPWLIFKLSASFIVFLVSSSSMLDFYVYVPFLITWPWFRCWENRGNCIFFFLVLLQFCHIALQNPRSYPDFQLVLLYFWFHRAQCLIFVFTCHFSSLLGLCFVYEKKEETAFLFFLVVVVVVVLFLLLLQFCRIALQNPSSYSNFQLVLLYFWFHRVQCLIFVFTCYFSSLLGLYSTVLSYCSPKP